MDLEQIFIFGGQGRRLKDCTKFKQPFQKPIIYIFSSLVRAFEDDLGERYLKKELNEWV